MKPIRARLRRIGLMALALAALPLVARTADAPASNRHAYTIPHVLRYATGEDIVGLNPHLNAQGTLQYMSSLTMAFLVKYDRHNRPVPELVTAIPSQANGGISTDGRTITYHLRGDAKWSDGVPFTSDDVKFSVAVVADPENNEVSREGFDDVTSVDTPNPTTVVFHLRKPYSGFYVNFFSSSGAPCILPRHVLNSTKINTAPYNDLPVGIGPFKYAAWRRNDAVEMVANPLYFRGAPKLARVIFKLIPDRNTTLTQLTTHEIDLWLPVSPAFADRVKGLPGVTVQQQPSYLYDHIDFNVAHPPLDDPVVRRALRLAIDRATILAKVRHGNGILQEGIFAPTHPLFDSGLRAVPFDLRQANALLDAAGWQRGADGIRAKGGKRLEFVYASGTGLPDTDQQIELIRATWKQIGVDFTVQRYPSSTYFAPAQTGGILLGGKFDIANFAWYATVDGNVQNLYGCDRFPPKGQNDMHYCDPAADRAMNHLLETYDKRAQVAAGRALQASLVADAPTLVLDIRKDTFAFNSDLTNFHPNQVTAFDDLRDVDI